MPRSLACFIRCCALALVAASLCAAQEEPPSWFEVGQIPELRFKLDAPGMSKLHDAPRELVRGDLIEGDGTAHSVGVKLKGSAGSFRSLIDRPGFTIDVNRFETGSEFHGLVKFHLNNAVQDQSLLQEFLAYEVFRRAGQAAPRVTHAWVRLNDRDLGLYVLKESYDRRFLSRCFADADGNLYDGGVNGEVHHDLDRDEGTGPIDRSDLKALAAACALPPGPLRRERIEACLDVPTFLSFMACEVMIGHWDGYTQNPNNYRIYFPKKTKRAVFIPHGADQVFVDPEAPLFQSARGRVASVVLSDPTWRNAFRQRMRELLPILAPPDGLIAALRAKAARLRPIVKAARGSKFADELAASQAELEHRVKERAAFLVRECERSWKLPFDLEAANGSLASCEWIRHKNCDDVVLESAEPADSNLSIRAGTCGRCIASWRTELLLEPGRYEFLASLTTNRVVAHSLDEHPGAGIRISGQKRPWLLEGTVTDHPVTFAFTVSDHPQFIVLVLELRASRGTAHFPKKSLRLLKR